MRIMLIVLGFEKPTRFVCILNNSSSSSRAYAPGWVQDTSLLYYSCACSPAESCLTFGRQNKIKHHDLKNIPHASDIRKHPGDSFRRLQTTYSPRSGSVSLDFKSLCTCLDFVSNTLKTAEGFARIQYYVWKIFSHCNFHSAWIIYVVYTSTFYNY